MDDFVARAILRYQIDKASLAQTSSALKGAKADLVGIAGAAQALDKTYLGVANHMLRFSNNVEKNTSDLQKLRGELNGVAESAVKASKGLTLGKAESVLQRGGRALSGLGISGAGDALSGGADVLQLLNTAKEGLAAFAPAATAAGTATTVASGGLAAMSAALVPLLAILAPLAVGVIAAVAALKILDAQTELLTSGLARRAQVLEKFDKLISGTEDEGLTGIQQNQKDIASLKRQAARLKEETDKTFAEAQAKFGDAGARIGLSRDKAYNDAIAQIEALNKLITTLGELSNDAFADIQDGATKAADAAAAAKKAEEELAAARDKANRLIMNFIGGFIAEGEQTAKTVGKLWDTIQKDTADRQKRIADTQQKYNTDVEAISQESVDQRLAIEERYADLVAGILEKAIEDNASALAELQSKQADLLLSAGRDNEKEARKQALDDTQSEIKARRTERDDLVSHLRKVREIQNASKSEERDALLDRNFLALFQLQENKKDQQAEEAQAYEDQKAGRQQALEDERSDTQRQRVFEANERKLALQQQLSDARRAYMAELAQTQAAKLKALQIAQSAYNAELTALTAKTARELSIKYDGYVKELQLAVLSRNERLKIEQETQNALVAQALATRAAIRGVLGPLDAPMPSTPRSTNTNKLRAFADGGNAIAGHPFLFNDKFPGQRESMNGVMLPQGMGVAIPYQSGRVDPGSGGGVMLSQTFQIDGSGNPEVTARTIARISRQELVKFLNESIG